MAATKKTITTPAKKAPVKKAAVTKKAGSKKDVAGLIRANIKKNMGADPVSKNLSGLDVVPSGSLLVDTLIGGTLATDGKTLVCPGYPRRYMVELYGPESSGKTTMSLEAVASAQQEGGVAVFLDFEHALQHGYAQNLGVNFDQSNLLIYQPNTLEDGVKDIYISIMAGADLIVVDSVSAMIPASSLGKKVDQAETIGAQARQMSRFLPLIQKWLHDAPGRGTSLIWVNQERSAIDGQQAKGANKNTSGGKALKFYCAVRLRTTSKGHEYVKRKDPATRKSRSFPYGNKTNVRVIKNKLDGKQGHETEIFIRYGQGIDELFSIIDTASAHGIVKRNGAVYTYGPHKIKGREGMRTFFREHPSIFTEVKGLVGEAIRSEDLAALGEDPSQEDLIEEGLDGLNVIMGDAGDTVLDDVPSDFDEDAFEASDIEEEDSGEGMGDVDEPDDVAEAEEALAD